MAIATVSAQETTISVEPHLYTAGDIGDVFTININIYSVADLYGFEFKLGYDTTLLDGIDVTLPLGHFLTPSDPTKLIVGWQEVKDDYNATHGRVWLAVTLLSPEPPKSGSGILATITFNVTGIGSCALHLYDVGLADSKVKPISHRTIDGKVTTSVRGLWLEPSFTDNLNKCEEFSVSLMVNITDPDGPGPATGLYKWEYKLYWNTSWLSLNSCDPVIKLGTNDALLGWGFNYTMPANVEGANYHWYAISALSPAPPFTGVMWLCNYTFHVEEQPYEPAPAYTGNFSFHLEALADDKVQDIIDPGDWVIGTFRIQPAQALWLEPSFTDNLNKCEEFSVSLMVNITEPTPGGGRGLYMWEYELYWNTSWLSLVDHDPVIYSGVNDIILGWHANYYIAADDVGAHYHWYAVCALYPAPAFTGVTWLCNYTFHVEEQPYQPQPAYTGQFDFHLEALADDEFGDYIPEDTDWVIGTFRIQPATPSTPSAPLPVENIAIVIVIAIFFVAALYYVKKRILK